VSDFNEVDVSGIYSSFDDIFGMDLGYEFDSEDPKFISNLDQIETDLYGVQQQMGNFDSTDYTGLYQISSFPDLDVDALLSQYDPKTDTFFASSLTESTLSDVGTSGALVPSSDVVVGGSKYASYDNSLFLDTGAPKTTSKTGGREFEVNPSVAYVLTHPWADMGSTVVQQEGLLNVQNWRNEVINSFPNLDQDSINALFWLGGLKGATIDELRSALFVSGIDTRSITADQLVDKNQVIKDNLESLVASRGEEYIIQSYTPSSDVGQIAKVKLTDALNAQYPSGKSNGLNSLLASAYPELAMTVYLRVNKYEDAINFMNTVIAVKAGGGDEGLVRGFLSDKLGFDNPEDKNWQESSVAYKEAKLASIMASGIRYNINSEFVARVINDLIIYQTDPNQRVELYNYVAQGGITNDAALSPQGSLMSSAWSLITSKSGSEIIGLVAAGSLVVGGLLVAGPGGAIAGLGTSPFALSEIKNYTGMDEFRTKQEMQNRNMYPPDIDAAAGYKYKDLTDSVSSMKYDTKNMSIADTDKAKANELKQIDAQISDIEKNALLLISNGTYNDRLKELNALRDDVVNYSSMVQVVDPVTGLTKEVGRDAAQDIAKWKASVPVPVTAPPGYTYKFAGDKEASDPKYLVATEGGKRVVELYKDGQLVMSKEVNLTDPDQPKGVDFSQAEIDRQSQYDSMGMSIPKTPFESVRTVILDPGMTAYLKSNPGQIFQGGKAYDLAATSNINDTLVVSQEGKNTKEVPVNFYGAAWALLTIPMTDTFVSYSESANPGVVFFNNIPTTPGTKLYINGEEVDPTRAMGYQAPKGVTESISLKLVVPGYTDYVKQIQLDPGDKQEMDLTSLYKEYSKSAGSSGGGGGGSGGITINQSNNYAAKSTSKIGYISFGPTMSYKEVVLTLDDAQIIPVINQVYTVDTGYHAVKATREGYLDYIKQVYIGPDDSIKVNATWEAIYVAPGDEDTTTDPCPGPNCVYRVTFDSSPEGAKILIGDYVDEGQSDTGQWTPGKVDLLGGLYMLRLYKSGYNDYIAPLWVGPTCYLGGSALTAAGI
jgi:hypothetical protein